MEAGLAETKVTMDGHLEELARLREVTRASGNMAAAVQAEHLHGKATGLYMERHKDETESISNVYLIDKIRKLLGGDNTDKAMEVLGVY